MSLDQEQFGSSPPPPPRHSPIIPIDPFLGRRQSWTVVRQALLETLAAPETESRLPSQTSAEDQLVDYLASTIDAARPVLVLSDDSATSTRLLGRLAHRLEGEDEGKLSITFLRHQPRLNRLPLLLRKTGLELTAASDDHPPAPTSNHNITGWFRSVLASLTGRNVIIWDSIDSGTELETGVPWLWLTSPLPPGVKLIISARNDPSLRGLITLWQSRGMMTINISPSDERTLTREDQHSHEQSLPDEMAKILAISRGGRTVEELAELLPLASETELEDAIQQLGLQVETIENGRLSLTTAEKNLHGNSETRTGLVDWFATQSRQSDQWLWEYPWQLSQLGRWDEIRQLLTDPTITGRLWSHERADLIDYVTKIDKDKPGSWRSICDQAKQLSDFRPHHGLAYAGLLMELHDFESARSLLKDVVEHAMATGSTLHASLARRRGVECARQAGDHGAAWSEFERMEQEFPRPSDFRVSGQWSLLAADLLIDLQKLPEAESRLLVLEEEAHESGNVWFETESLVRQAALAALRNDTAGLSTIDSRLLANARTQGWNQSHLPSLSREIQRKLDAQDWQEAESLARRQQEVAARLADVDSLSQSLGTLAFLMNRQGQFPEMTALLGAKERLCREVGDLPAAIDLLLSRAVVVGLRMGDVATAIPLAEEAFQLAEEKRDVERTAKAHQLLDRLRTAKKASSS